VPVRSALQRVAHQRNHARDAKAGERQHQSPVALPRQRQIRRIDPLRKHLARKRLGQLVVNARQLRAVDHRAARQSRQTILGLL
jgi:hypothetical protein